MVSINQGRQAVNRYWPDVADTAAWAGQTAGTYGQSAPAGDGDAPTGAPVTGGLGVGLGLTAPGVGLGLTALGVGLGLTAL